MLGDVPLGLLDAQAFALVRRVSAEGREITDADLDTLRNICRCGTYPRIREAIRSAAL
nr:hypothetical protein [Saccharopolyspora rhizosphaerae]